MTYGEPKALPPLVRQATELAEQRGFGSSCLPAVGRLLASLAARRGTVGETGTGYGVGSGWLLSGTPADARLVTVEIDAGRAAAARELLGVDLRATVLTGDWRRLAERAPYSLIFCDGGGKREGGDVLIDMLVPGGLIVLDDFTPSDGWPPMFAGQRDTLREWWLMHPRLMAAEIRTTATTAAIVAARRPLC